VFDTILHNAMIGFSEVLTDRMFGELNETQAEYLKDIYVSGTHVSDQRHPWRQTAAAV